jgi:energy-coupling factor transporter ATP-binding protein EcfA2
MFGLQQIISCHPAELPYVMRKRISLAATLAMDRPWYILDEPTLVQDESFVQFLVTLLNSLNSKGKGVIIISHSKRITEQLNCQEMLLNKGKLSH